MSSYRISFLLDSPEGEELLFTYQPFCPPYQQGQTIFLEKEVHPNCKEKGFKMTKYQITKVHHSFKENVRMEVGGRLKTTDYLSVEVYVEEENYLSGQ